MTRDVLLSIKGLQIDLVGEGAAVNEPIEIITPASYFCKNGKHYIIYDEVTEGMQGVTKNKIKIIDESSIEILKSGNVNAHMIFQKGKDSMTYYNTPFGQILVGIHTTDIGLDITDSHILVQVNYGLDINHEPLADCEIKMDVQSKEVKEFPFA